MSLQFKKIEDKETEVLPDKETGEDVSVDTSIEEKRRLEIENAEMRGRLSVIDEQKRTVNTNSTEQIKAKVMGDVNGLEDDKFQELYHMTKSQAVAAIYEQENKQSRVEMRRATAEAEANSEMGIKYGSEYYRFKNQIDESIADLSDEARTDPKRLAKHKERMFLSLQKETAIRSNKDDSRKKIVNDFEPPTPPIDKKNEEIKNEEIPDKYRSLTKVFGLKDEKERKEYMQMIKDGSFVPMDMGGGMVFRHPDRGFEVAEKK